MAFVSFEEKKQKKIIYWLIGLFGLAIIIIVGYLGLVVSPTPSLVKQAEIEGLIQRIDFEASFLETKQFEQLEIYGQWPISVQQKGRSNPFLPF